jgi:hypothetical protein
VFQSTPAIKTVATTKNGQKRTDLNPFKELLKSTGLYRNKHIPDSYIYNSKEVRLQLLAGFIDTDGSIKQNNTPAPRFEICQSDRLHGHMIDQLDIVAKSLGFSTTISYSCINEKTSKGESKKMKTINIFGEDLSIIPTRLPRKKIIVTGDRHTHINNYTRFTITSIGQGEFYGWMVDGNERFLLGDYTVTHNSRLYGGEDSASERYIFTQLNGLTRGIFPEADDAILDYTDDDGTLVEPEYYVPILPFCLVNGISGIGTGFSCDVPSYDPKAIIAYLKAKLYSSPLPVSSFVPYYEGFKGSVTKTSGDRWLIKGVYERVGEDSLRITELPIGTWTMSYITMLEGLLDGGVDKAGKKVAPLLKDMVNMSTEVLVDITVTFPKGDVAKLLASPADPAGITAVEKLLKLTTTVSESNMHLFDADCRLHKYQSVEEIIDAFYDVRLRTYQKRKDALVAAMRALLVKLSNRARYIQATLRGEVDLRRKSNVQVLEMLEQMAYDKIDGDYKYLVKMPMDSVTDEHATKIMKEHVDTEHELAVLLGTSLRDMWIRELDAFEKEYDAYRVKRAALLKPTTSGGGGAASKTKSKK